MSIEKINELLVHFKMFITCFKIDIQKNLCFRQDNIFKLRNLNSEFGNT